MKKEMMAIIFGCFLGIAATTAGGILIVRKSAKNASTKADDMLVKFKERTGDAIDSVKAKFKR